MRIHALHAVALSACASLLAAAGCSASPPTDGPRPPAVPTATASATAAASASASAIVLSSPTLPTSPCATLLAGHESVIAGARAPAGTPRPLEPQCYTGPNGSTWAVVLTELTYKKDGTDDDFTGQHTIVHLHGSGAVTSISPPLPKELASAGNGSNFHQGPFFGSGPGEAAFFDFDGDGDAELILPESSHEHEGPSIPYGRVWTFHDGRITLYAGTPEIVLRAEDGDGDGRPDLVTPGPYTGHATACGSGFAWFVTGPELLAHALNDGSFSTSDAAAQAFAKKSCPQKPKTLVERANGYVDSYATYQHLACSALWGADRAALEKRFAKECAPTKKRKPDEPDDCSACDDIELGRTWAQKTPPLKLTSP